MKGQWAPPVTGGLFYDANASPYPCDCAERAAGAHGHAAEPVHGADPAGHPDIHLCVGGHDGSEERGRGGDQRRLGVLEPGGHQPAARFADLQAHHVRGRFQEGRRSHQPSGRAGGDALPERLFRQSGAGRARRSAIVAGRAAIQHRPDFDAVCPADRTGAGNGDARFRAGQAFPRRGRGAELVQPEPRFPLVHPAEPDRHDQLL